MQNNNLPPLKQNTEEVAPLNRITNLINATQSILDSDDIDFSEKPAEWFNTLKRRKLWWDILSKEWQETLLKKVFKNFTHTLLDDLINEVFRSSEINIDGSLFEGIRQGNITELIPLKNLTNLQKLGCRNNQISSLEPLKNLTNLQSLDCRNNQISSLEPLKNLTNLQSLLCGNNPINSLEPLKNLTNLQHLGCKNNQISSLEPLKNLTNLQRLGCIENQISSLEPLKSLTNLQILWCNNNTINSLGFSQNLCNLKTLNCRDNKINSLESLQNLSSLNSLYCDNNQITNLEPLHNLKELRSVYATGNPISQEEIRSFRRALTNCSISCDDPEMVSLRIELKALDADYSDWVAEYDDLRKTIADFELRYHQELGDLLAALLRHKAQQAENDYKADQISEEEYHAQQEQYKRFREDSQQAKAKKQQQHDLSEANKKHLKQLHREAVKLCHPDKVAELLKNQAEAVFIRLQTAYENNDLTTVAQILDDLKNGSFHIVDLADDTTQNVSKEQLKAQIQLIRTKITAIKDQIAEIKASETYQIIANIDDLDKYFADLKAELEERLKECEQ